MSFSVSLKNCNTKNGCRPRKINVEYSLIPEYSTKFNVKKEESTEFQFLHIRYMKAWIELSQTGYYKIVYSFFTELNTLYWIDHDDGDYCCTELATANLDEIERYMKFLTGTSIDGKQLKKYIESNLLKS